jgi:hypothetical protein
MLKKPFIKRLAKGKKEKKYLISSIELKQDLLRREILYSIIT